MPATATPTATPSAIATPSPTVTPSPSATPTLTPTSTGTPALAVLDIDGNGETDALTDGLLVLYWLFGFSDDELPAEAIEQPCTRCDASAIESYLESIETQLDIDSNGATSPLTDGVLVMRFLSGFTHGALTAGAVDEGCTTRCEAEAIEAYLQTLI